MSAQIIDLKQLKKEMEERPPALPKVFKPRPPRKYIPKRFLPRAEAVLPSVAEQNSVRPEEKEAAVFKKEVPVFTAPMAEKKTPETAETTRATAVTPEKSAEIILAKIPEPPPETLEADQVKKIEAKETDKKPGLFPVQKDNFLVAVAEKTMQEVIKEEIKEVDQNPKTPTALSWQAPEYVRADNSYEKAILAGIIAAGFFIGSLVISNYLLALIILLAYIIIYVHSVKKPAMINFAVTVRGIQAGKSLYEFSDLKSFWIFYDPPYQKELSVESKKVFMPYVKIPLSDVSPSELRKALVRYIPEKKHEEALTDIVARRAGF